MLGQWRSWHFWRPRREHTKVPPPVSPQWIFPTFSNSTVLTAIWRPPPSRWHPRRPPGSPVPRNGPVLGHPAGTMRGQFHWSPPWTPVTCSEEDVLLLARATRDTRLHLSITDITEPSEQTCSSDWSRSGRSLPGV